MHKVTNVDVHLKNGSCSTFNKNKTECKFITYDYKASFFVVMIYFQDSSIQEIAFPSSEIEYTDSIKEYATTNL